MSKHMVWKQRDQLKIQIPEGVKHVVAYRNLMYQLNKIVRHNRQGSFKTRDRYYEAVDCFAQHLADSLNVQKFNNISGKHLTSYIQQMQTKGLSASTIKTDFATIRFFHDKFDTRYITKQLKIPPHGRGYRWCPNGCIGTYPHVDEGYCQYCKSKAKAFELLQESRIEEADVLF